MKKLFIHTIGLLALLSCTNNPTQQKEVEKIVISIDSISVTPNWGDEILVKLEQKKTRKVNRSGITQSGTSVGDIELKITKSGNNYRCQWKIKDVRLPSINNPIEKKVEKLINGFNYDFVLDSSGYFLELMNWEEIHTMGLEAMEILIDEIKKDPIMTPQVIEQMRMTIGEMFNTKEKIETYLMQEIQLYFAVSGIALAENDTIAGIAFTTHPLTGDIIPQNLQTVYQNAYSDSTCDIQVVQSVDESYLYEAVKNTVDMVAGEDQISEFEQEMSGIKFNLEIITDYNVSLKTGLVEQVISEKTINVGDMERTDIVEITRIE